MLFTHPTQHCRFVCKTEHKIPIWWLLRHEESLLKKMRWMWFDWVFLGVPLAGVGKKKALMCGRLFYWFTMCAETWF